MFIFNHKKNAPRAGRSAMDSRQQQQAGRRPRLERRNAVKRVEYGTAEESWFSRVSPASEESTNLRTRRSLDIFPSTYAHQTSFRIGGGIEGEVDLLCRNLGLSGPEDFSISIADWERRKVRSSSDIFPRSRLLPSCSISDKDSTLASDSSPSETETKIRASDTSPDLSPCSSPSSRGRDGGIRGVRPPLLYPPLPPMPTISSPPISIIDNPPPVLKPPESMSLSTMHGESSTWDIPTSVSPEERSFDSVRRNSIEFEEDEQRVRTLMEDEVNEEELRLWYGEISEGFTGTSSYSTMNDDESSRTTTETMFIISPNGRFKRKSWLRGKLLGSGSYGTVYEGISKEGAFFAVKEVSLLDQGSNAEQCILQLEQEIALLSQFKHGNIVQYYGTEKEDSKLYIFLELVTQGSLASLYQKYRLQDSQASAYTRQILSGLKYLHDRNVVHRDIKCANILVHVNGSVKLADFGLAKEITKFNMLKSCKGSVYWMAPEVVRPKRSYGPAADIWSLGCTVLEMLTCQIPYPNLEWAQAFFRIGRGEPPAIPTSLSADARDFISRCVKVNPYDRPTTYQLLEHPFIKRSRTSGSNSSSFNNER